jgi:hypothetical protein
MVTGNLIEVGNITSVSLDGEKYSSPLAMLITFKNVDDIRKAIADGKCSFTFMESEEPTP